MGLGEIQNCRTEMDPQTLAKKFMGTCCEEGGLGVGGWHMHTVVYGIIAQWGLLYSTEISTQYSMIPIQENKLKKNGCVYT